MPKIKLSVKEMRRISLIIGRDIQSKKATLENVKKQEWCNDEKKKIQISLIEKDISFVELIKEKFDSETFGRG